MQRGVVDQGSRGPGGRGRTLTLPRPSTHFCNRPPTAVQWEYRRNAEAITLHSRGTCVLPRRLHGFEDASGPLTASVEFLHLIKTFRGDENGDRDDEGNGE